MTEPAFEPLVYGGQSVSRREPHRSGVRVPRNLIQVPSLKQRTNFSCGTVATLALLRYWRADAYARVQESDLYWPLQTTYERGTDPQPIATFLNTVPGVAAEYRHSDVSVGDLERAVDARQPPIVDLQAWRDDDAPWRETWDAGHYVVMVGYDDERAFFMDPSTMTPGRYAFLPRTEFDERWHDLAGDHDARTERMAIFVRGSTIALEADEWPSETATKLA
jgi:predicted double-glycine peptidase